MKEASVKAGPNTNHVQFPEEAVQALPPAGSKAPSTRLHRVPRAGCESTRRRGAPELARPALHQGNPHTLIRHRGSSAAAAPEPALPARSPGGGSGLLRGEQNDTLNRTQNETAWPFAY